MGLYSKNNFRRAIHHLKSTKIDEKIELLNELPTNNTYGIYVVEPQSFVQDPDIPGFQPVDFTQDDPSLNGRDTTGLFDNSGNILTIEPPGDTSYILGPMASMWYAWGNFSTIGYIRESDRRMVDLGRIVGRLGSWDGVSNFTSYGQLTLEQAVWFKDTPKLNGADNNTPNYRAFYPGPPSNTPDEFGRYLCVITGTPKPTTKTPPIRRVPPTMGPSNPTDNFALQLDNNKKKKGDDKLAQYTDDPSTWPSIKNPVRTPPPIIDPNTGWPSVPNVPRPYKGKPGGPPVRLASYNPKGQVLSESKKSILKNIKKPYVLPEQPKVKYKIKPKLNRTINADLMKKAEVPSSFKNAEDRMWGKYEKNKNTRMSQERKNEVLDHLGGSDHFWEYMTETSRQKSNDIMYGNFGGKSKKGKIVRKEEIKGDTLLFICDETGNKESILQSELSIRLADEFNRELFEKYFQEQETIQADKDPLFKKVSKILKKEIDYLDKPSKKGYPNDPPPKMVNGWHPDYGKDKGFYNKLDPQSAKSMPLTGNPVIDKKIKKARKKVKKAKRKIEIKNIEKQIEENKIRKVKNLNSPEFSNWRCELEEGMTSSGTFQTTLPATGDVNLETISISDASSIGASQGSGNFDISGSYIQFDGEPSSTFRTSLFTVDASKYTTITFSAIAGNDSNGGDTPSNPLIVYWLSSSGKFGTLGSIPSNTSSLTQFSFDIPSEARGEGLSILFADEPGDPITIDDTFYVGKTISSHPSTIGVGASYWIYEVIRLHPTWNNNAEVLGASASFRTLLAWSHLQSTYIGQTSDSILFPNWPADVGVGYPAPISGGKSSVSLEDLEAIHSNIIATFGTDQTGRQPITYGITDLNFRRTTPITVFVPLDSPEANDFIRTDPIMANLSPEERKKKLQDMLEASDEYLDKIFGGGFPGTGLDPAVGEAGDTPGVDTIDYGTDLTPLSDNPYGTEVAQVATAADLAGLGIGTEEAIAMGAAGIAALFGMGIEAAQNIINQVQQMVGGTDWGAAPGQDTIPQDDGPSIGQQGKELTPQQQAEVEAAGKELRDAQRALNDLPPDATAAQRDMAQARLDKAIKRRQSLRNKHREENKNRKESFETKREVITEKKKLKSPEEVLNKIPGYYDGKPAPLGFPVEKPPEMKNGMHPDLVDGKKVADRFNRLDPQSAKAMPLTGNPYIDKKVKDARKKPK